MHRKDSNNISISRNKCRLEFNMKNYGERAEKNRAKKNEENRERKKIRTKEIKIEMKRIYPKKKTKNKNKLH